VSSAEVNATYAVEVVDGRISIRPSGATVNLGNVAVGSSNSALDIIDMLWSGLEGFAEDAIEKLLVDRGIAKRLQKALDDAPRSIDFDVPKLDGSGDKVPVTAFADIANVSLSEAGLLLGVKVGASTSVEPPAPTLGMARRMGCLRDDDPRTPPMTDPMEVLLLSSGDDGSRAPRRRRVGGHVPAAVDRREGARVALRAIVRGQGAGVQGERRCLVQ
jgi:hypothetical protein